MTPRPIFSSLHKSFINPVDPDFLLSCGHIRINPGVIGKVVSHGLMDRFFRHQTYYQCSIKNIAQVVVILKQELKIYDLTYHDKQYCAKL